MEKYCTLAVFVCMGLPLFVRGLIFLDSDASLNIDNGTFVTFENRDNYHELSSENPIMVGGHDSVNSLPLNIDEKSNGKDNEIISHGFENHENHHDLSSKNRIIVDGRDSTKSVALNIDENSTSKDDETISPSIQNSDIDYPLENLISGGDPEMVQSNPVMEEIPKDIELIYQLNKKRHVPDRGFTEETKKLVLDLHNIYRGNVTPPAADMNFMEWDENLEHLAQLWADNCKFEHGKPSPKYSVEGKIKPYGQNLYIGTDPSGYKGLWMWYEEYMHYTLRNESCKPNEQCGHYVQMAWSESKRLGCGITLCGMRYLIVCHYYPGAVKGVQMFQIGRPCSQCDEKEGALCKDKLCMSHELCRRRPKLCESATCKMKCRNCGKLNKTACQCTCADGWDSPDCSKPCEDAHERCGIQPGFPNKASCSIQNYAVAKKYCRKMCDTCFPVTNDAKINHLCCEGRLCEKGYVLDLERKPCRCTLLCPGPECDFMDDESSTLKNSFIHLISMILVLFFLNYTNHSL